MSLQFSGEERFAAPCAHVYALLTDLDALAAGLPDVASTERIDARTVRAVVRPGFSFLRGTLKLRLSLAELHEPASAVLNIDAAGIGASMRVEARWQLTDEGEAARLTWQANVTELKGLVAAVSPGLIRAAAEQTIVRGWQQVRARLKPAS